MGRAVKTTGIWTDGVLQGLMIAGPPLVLISASLGLMLALSRRALTLEGGGGIN